MRRVFKFCTVFSLEIKQQHGRLRRPVFAHGKRGVPLSTLPEVPSGRENEIAKCNSFPRASSLGTRPRRQGQAASRCAPKRAALTAAALQLIHGAVRLSAHVIARRPEAFPAQMVGRLLPHQASGTVAAFTKDVAEGAPRPWLKPLWPSLHPPAPVCCARWKAIPPLSLAWR